MCSTSSLYGVKILNLQEGICHSVQEVGISERGWVCPEVNMSGGRYVQEWIPTPWTRDLGWIATPLTDTDT